ncbi:ArsB/NhaD family transporter [Anaeromyxobacter paludicola]|uniref:Anion transporter n=1 Tax=Anaeromyxobacter paludicola TaxID=2918171 RepID=A0ABM7X711_9BACT|nr:anion transporter [Anaeromyxobacter paludicola]BDG07630.1 anion transporter [Anaeromyxobacter paludicola]
MAALLVFVLTYVAIAAGRFPGLSLDRPAAALLGAALMVALRVLTPAEAGAAINGDTIGLLLGMMILTAYLTEAGFFRWASWKVVTSVRTPRALLWAVVLGAGGLSAFLVNDTVCLMMTPLVLRVVDEAELPPTPFLLALAFGANAGSSATLTGNPQNMIVGTLSGIPYARFAGALAAPALFSLCAVALLLQWRFRAELVERPLAGRRLPRPPIQPRPLRRALACTALVLLGFLAGLPLSWTALFGAALCMAISGRAPREALQRVDWPLLLFFAGLFVVVAGVGKAGLADRMHGAIAPWLGAGPVRQTAVFSLFTVAASQVVSNVPFVVLAGHWVPRLAEPGLGWLVTALASTLAGNLTVVGSVANLIVLEMAGPGRRIPFWPFLRVGAVVTGVTLAGSLLILLAERALGVLP